MKILRKKARAYDEAIRKAAALYKASEPMSGCNVILETLFPELKESEDEKIRKALIEYFNEQCDMSDWNGVYGYQVVSWLEKQETSYTKRDVDKCNSAWSKEEERYICQLESMVKEKWALAEKAQDEDVIKNMSNLAFFLKTLNPNKKPADEEMKALLRTEYEKGRADAIAEIQKEWSEEDDQYVEDITALIQRGLSYHSIGQVQEWLKSLKSRVQPQPKQEWSDKDKKYLNIIKSIINNPSIQGIYDYHKVNRTDVGKWFDKFIRPQNRWKPSDEQMKLLSEVQSALLGKDCHNRFTDFMWDLKKLK